MTSHRIARAAPRRDFTVDIEWTDGSRSTVDLKPEIARGGVLTDLGEPAVFQRRMFLHAEGESLAWEVFGQFVDFHADNLWAASHAKPAAA